MFQDDAAAASDFVKKTLNNLSAGTDTEGAVAQSDLVLEAIVENIKIKQELFARLDKVIFPSSYMEILEQFIPVLALWFVQ